MLGVVIAEELTGSANDYLYNITENGKIPGLMGYSQIKRIFRLFQCDLELTPFRYSQSTISDQLLHGYSNLKAERGG